MPAVKRRHAYVIAQHVGSGAGPHGAIIAENAWRLRTWNLLGLGRSTIFHAVLVG